MEGRFEVEIRLERGIIMITNDEDESISLPASVAISGELQAEIQKAADAIVLWDAVNID